MPKSDKTAATNSHWVEANQISVPIQPVIEKRTEATAPNISILEVNSLFLLPNTHHHPLTNINIPLDRENK